MKITCPHCGASFDAHKNIGAGDITGDSEARPTNGSLSFCIYCGMFSIFCDDGTRVRPIQPEDEVGMTNQTRQFMRKVWLSWGSLLARNPKET